MMKNIPLAPFKGGFRIDRIHIETEIAKRIIN
jgi:hypothetical protein